MSETHPPHDSCPPQRELSALVLGTLDSQRAETLFEHLRSCKACAARVQQLDGIIDPLIDDLRRGDDRDYSLEPGYQRSLERLQHLTRQYHQGLVMPAAVDMEPDETPPKRLRDYELGKRLGRGGIGTVYLAWHRRLKRPVAIKLLDRKWVADPDAEQRFLQEIEAIGQIEHPLIVRATDAGREDEWLFLVMEYVAGMNLSQILARRGPWEVADAVHVVREVALGLEVVHQRGLVHRDIKPSNLMLDETGQIKILDLSLASLKRGWQGENQPGSRRASGASWRATGRVMGTADYMAPEQAERFQEADRRADIYSLGCTLYRLLTGRVPYPGQSTSEKLAAHAQTPIPSLRSNRPEVPAELENVFTRMLAKEPEQRFATALEVVAALDSIHLPQPTRMNTQALSADALSAENLLIRMREQMVNGTDWERGTSRVGSPIRPQILPPSRSRIWSVSTLLLILMLGVPVAGWLGWRAMGPRPEVQRSTSWRLPKGVLRRSLPETDVVDLAWKASEPLRLTVLMPRRVQEYQIEWEVDAGRLEGGQLQLDQPLPVHRGDNQVVALSRTGSEPLVATVSQGAPGQTPIVWLDRVAYGPWLDFEAPQGGLVDLVLDAAGQHCFVLQPSGAIQSARLPDRSTVLSGDEARIAWQSLPEPEGSSGPWSQMFLSERGRYLVAGQSPPAVYDRQSERWLSADKGTPPSSSADGAWIMGGCVPGASAFLLAFTRHLEVWRVDEGLGRLGRVWHHDVEVPVTAVGIASETQRFAIGFADGTVEVWDLEAGDRIDGLRVGDETPVDRLALSPSGEIIAITQQDRLSVVPVQPQGPD